MKTETKVLGAILIATVVLLVGAVFFLGQGSKSSQNILSSAVSPIDYSKGEKIGSDSAKVKVVEFSDLQCPACLAAEPFVKQVRSKENVQLIYRHFPLTQHVYSRKVAYLAEEAGSEGKFWDMHDKLFETQNEWSAMSDNDANAFFLKLTEDLNLNEDKVKEALNNNVFKAKVDDDQNEGVRLGVNATPTFFINGHKLNLQSFADLVTVVESELKK